MFLQLPSDHFLLSCLRSFCYALKLTEKVAAFLGLVHIFCSRALVLAPIWNTCLDILPVGSHDKETIRRFPRFRSRHIDWLSDVSEALMEPMLVTISLVSRCASVPGVRIISKVTKRVRPMNQRRSRAPGQLPLAPSIPEI